VNLLVMLCRRLQVVHGNELRFGAADDILHESSFLVLTCLFVAVHCTLCRRMQDENELRFGVVDDVLYGLKSPPVPGAQWTGVVTGIAVQMLESGAVDAVVCVQSDPNDR
jgi:coenzyme F420-reducing hydrogenase beta subunit